MKKKLLCLLLAAVMLLGMIPAAVFAGGPIPPAPPAPTEEPTPFRVEGTDYSLSDAVTYVTEGGTITMTNNFTLDDGSFTFGGEKTFTLDLAGHTITVSGIVISGSSGSINKIKFYNPNMRVTDSSKDQTGAITAKDSAQLLLRYDQFWDITKVTADGSCQSGFHTHPSEVVYEGDLAKEIALAAEPDAICMTGGTGYKTLADAVSAGGDILMWGTDSSETAIELTTGSLTLQDGASYTGDVTVNGGKLTVESGATLKNVTYTSGKLLTDADVTFESLSGVVAKYGPDYNTGKYVYCSSISDLAINNQTESGVTVTLLDDISLTSLWQINGYTNTSARGPFTYNVTLDLNGHKITSSAQIQISKGTLVITDSSEGTTGAIIASGSDMFLLNGSGSTGGKLIINKGNFTMNSQNWAVIRDSNSSAIGAEINGGTFDIKDGNLVAHDRAPLVINGGSFTVQSGACLFAPSGMGNITIKDGTFSGLKISDFSSTFVETNQTVLVQGGTYDADVKPYCAMGKTTRKLSDDPVSYGIVARTADDSTLYLEHNGVRIYGDSIKNALSQAQDGDTIVLLTDVDFMEMCYTDANDITIDLNTHTLGKTGIENGQLRIDHDMTVKNGTILCKSTSNSSAIDVYGNKDVHLTLENVKVKAACSNAPVEIFANRSSNTVSLRITAKGQNEIETIDEDGNIDYGYAIVIATDEQGYASSRSGTQNLTIDGDGTLKLYGGIYVESTAGMTGKNPHKNTITISNPNVEIPLHKYQISTFDMQDPSLTAYYYGNYQASSISALNYSPSVQLNISGGRYFSTFEEMAFDISGDCIEMPDGVTMFDGSVLTGGQYFAKPAARYIADGYEAVPYNNPAYPGLHYEIVKIKQVDAGTATVTEGEGGDKVITIETHGEDNEISATKKGTNETIATQEVADIITNTLNNDAVSEFDGTNIDNHTNNTLIKEVLKEDSMVASDDTAKANIDAATNILKQITVDLTATTVEMQQSGTAIREINSMTFDVKPIARITVEKGNGSETTVEVVIPNNLITEPLTFRLFVAPTEAKEAAVYHKGSEVGATKEYIGLYPIQKEDNKFFIELSAKEFSEYTYETVHINENAVAVIPDGNGNYNDYTTLAAAIVAAENGNTIILMKDIEATETIDFGSKTIALDLNGHVLTGTAENATGVTVSNNDAAKPDCLAVIGVFANDVKAFVADGYDAKTSTPAIGSVTNNEVFSNNASDVYTVKVVTSTDIDRDETNDEEIKNVDVFAGDHVYVEVRIYGARSVAAKVALKYDAANLTINAYPDGWVEADSDGIIRFYDANRDGITYWELDKIDEEGKPYYLLGYFDFTVDDVEESALAALAGENKDVNGNPVLKDMFEIVEDTYVAGAWKEGWSSNPANKVADDKCFDDFANIRLKQMSVTVTPSTGLVYKNANLYLFQNKDMEGVNKDFTATDKNTLEEVTGDDLVITYAVTAKGAEAPAASAYSTQYPTAKNAGDYTVYYKVTKPGYVTVTGHENVSIAKRDATLVWSAADFTAGSIVKTPENESFWTASDFWTSYDNKVFAAPTAKYVNADGSNTAVDAANITMTSPEGGTLKAVGSYVYTATLDDNYNVLNPTCTLLIDGGQINGYTLVNTDEGPSVFVDKQSHDVAEMDIADNATPATVKYYLSEDDGKTYGDALNEMPEVDKVGKYAVKAVITAPGYYDQEQIVKFEIKRVEFFTEKTEYVVGWKLILVYTNEAVPGFTYDGHYMYDVSTLGYNYLEQKDDLGTTLVAGTHYDHVYAILVEGAGDETKVVPSNDASTIHTIYPEKGTPLTFNRNDVNENGVCDINDLVAVQAVYNVDTERYLNDEMMHIALKADVTGNKMVNMADYQRIKSNS